MLELLERRQQPRLGRAPVPRGNAALRHGVLEVMGQADGAWRELGVRFVGSGPVAGARTRLLLEVLGELLRSSGAAAATRVRIEVSTEADLVLTVMDDAAPADHDHVEGSPGRDPSVTTVEHPSGWRIRHWRAPRREGA